MNQTREEKFEATIVEAFPSGLPSFVDLSNVERNNIILEKYLKLGDLVVMHMDKEARGLGVKGVSDGTVGIVVGFRRYKDYVARIHNYGRAPGVYEGNGVATVRWMDGSISEPGAGSLRWLFNHESKQRERRDDRLYTEAFEYMARVDDLPKLPLWEMDVVRIKHRKGQTQPWRHTDTVRIVSIDYHNLERKRNDGTPMPVFTVTPLEPGYGSVSMEVNDLELIERGNVWKWFNDQRDKLKFADIREEVAFHSALGMETQVMCEQGGNYHWPLTAILPALKAGTIDVVRFAGGMFGGSGTHCAYKMHDPDLSERLRAISLEGFDREKNPVQVLVTGQCWNEEAKRVALQTATEMQVPFVNLSNDGTYADDSVFKALNIEVVYVENPESFDFKALPGYVFFSPIGTDARRVPHNLTKEVRDLPDETARKRSKREALRLRIVHSDGWSSAVRNAVVLACQTFDVTFVDRAGVGGDKLMRNSGIRSLVLAADDAKLPIDLHFEGYAFFAHRGMKDLPYDVTIDLSKDVQ